MKISISGKAGSGKSTLANVFINKYGLEPVSFAKRLKELSMDLFGLSYDQAFGANKNRELLQVLGLKMREIDPDVWVKYVARSDRDNVVLDDLRYKNECQLMKDNGFVLIRIESDAAIRKERIPNTYPVDDSHISETDLDDFDGWDFVIQNNADLQTFLSSADTIHSLYKERV